MPKLSLWKKKKGNDYKFFDKTISEQFRIGGTCFFVHKLLGVHEQDATLDKTQPNITESNETTIQDLLLLENRDRKYDNDIYELRGSYTVTDNDFDLTQIGLFLSSDTIYVQFHLNDMIGILGRKLMPEDVIEVPHLEDDALLSKDPDQQFGPTIPRLYKVEEAARSSEGFSPTWWPHIWRVRISPLTDSQEFRDILGDGDEADDLKNLISTFNDEIFISDSIIAEAEREVPNRNLEHAHLFVMEENENGLPYLFMTDGEPPNGAELLGSGDGFPESPPDGSWFLRTDFEPNVLFKRVDDVKWERREVDYRQKWQTANRTLEKFINNRKKVDTDRGPIDSKVGISKVVAPRDRKKLIPDLGGDD